MTSCLNYKTSQLLVKLKEKKRAEGKKKIEQRKETERKTYTEDQRGGSRERE